jgi:hypothetical protein
MSRSRSEGQVMIGCWCEDQFVSKIDLARGRVSRSQFCRDALLEKLRAMGITVAASEASPPDRRGKGGRRARRTKSPGSTGPYVLNEKSPKKKS